MERWLPIAGTDGKFEVSDHGRVRGPRGLKTTTPDRYGYPRSFLFLNGERVGKSVHSLVAAAFIGPRPAGYDVDHIDRDKANNRVENLRYVTHAENMRLAFPDRKVHPPRPPRPPRSRVKRGPASLKGEMNGRSVLTAEQVQAIRSAARPGYGAALARQYGVSKVTISDILAGRTWKTEPNE